MSLSIPCRMLSCSPSSAGAQMLPPHIILTGTRGATARSQPNCTVFVPPRRRARHGQRHDERRSGSAATTSTISEHRQQSTTTTTASAGSAGVVARLLLGPRSDDRRAGDARAARVRRRRHRHGAGTQTAHGLTHGLAIPPRRNQRTHLRSPAPPPSLQAPSLCPHTNPSCTNPVVSPHPPAMECRCCCNCCTVLVSSPPHFSPFVSRPLDRVRVRLSLYCARGQVQRDSQGPTQVLILLMRLDALRSSLSCLRVHLNHPPPNADFKNNTPPFATMPVCTQGLVIFLPDNPAVPHSSDRNSVHARRMHLLQSGTRTACETARALFRTRPAAGAPNLDDSCLRSFASTHSSRRSPVLLRCRAWFGIHVFFCLLPFA